MGIAPSVIGHEETGKCSTPRIARILPKQLDPRSPSEGIIRTPIEVNCTPNSKNEAAGASTLASFDTPKRGKDCYDVSEAIKSLNLDCVEQRTELIETKIVETAYEHCEMLKFNETERTDNNSDAKCNISKEEQVLSTSGGKNHQDQDKVHFESAIKKTAYLETDIDKIDDKFMDSLYIEHPRVKQLKSRKIINKTGAGIIENYENEVDGTSEGRHSESLSTRFDSVSFSDAPSFDNLSLMVSDNEDVSLTTERNIVSKPTVQDWLITIEDNCDNFVPFDILPSDDIKSEISNGRDDPSVDITQSINCTPDNKKNHILNIERTPLSCIVQNKIFEPIKESSSLKKKQWRGIQEERQRRGLSLGDENTPPFQSPLDKVSSAPSKLATRRRNIIDWDQDNSSVVI